MLKLYHISQYIFRCLSFNISQNIYLYVETVPHFTICTFMSRLYHFSQYLLVCWYFTTIPNIYLNFETVPHFAVSIQSQTPLFGVMWGRTILELKTWMKWIQRHAGLWVITVLYNKSNGFALNLWSARHRIQADTLKIKISVYFFNNT